MNKLILFILFCLCFCDSNVFSQCENCTFIRGDGNCDGSVNLTDIINLLNMQAANFDAIASGGLLGVSAGMSVNYAASPVGTSALYSGLSKKMSSYRAGGCSTMSFNAAEKSEIENADPQNPVVSNVVVDSPSIDVNP